MRCPKCNSNNMVSTWPGKSKKHPKASSLIKWFLFVITLGQIFTLMKMLNYPRSRHTICLDCGYEANNWEQPY